MLEGDKRTKDSVESARFSVEGIPMQVFFLAINIEERFVSYTIDSH